MQEIQQDGKIGFLGGCFVTIGKSMLLTDVRDTVVLAIVGTVVSYFVSMLLKYWFGKKKGS